MNDFDRLLLRYYICIRLGVGALVLVWCLVALGMTISNRDGLPRRRDGGGTRYTTEIQP